MNLPAICPRCNIMFPSPISLVGVRMVISHVAVPCPQCGGYASLIDGEYEVTTNAIKILTAAALPSNVLFAFAQLLQKTNEQHSSIDELQQAAQQISPQLGKVVEVIKHSNLKAAVILILLVIILYKCNFNLNANVDIDVNDIFRTLLTQQSDGLSADPLDEPDHPDKEQSRGDSDAPSDNAGPKSQKGKTHDV